MKKILFIAVTFLQLFLTIFLITGISIVIFKLAFSWRSYISLSIVLRKLDYLYLIVFSCVWSLFNVTRYMEYVHSISFSSDRGEGLLLDLKHISKKIHYKVLMENTSEILLRVSQIRSFGLGGKIKVYIYGNSIKLIGKKYYIGKLITKLNKLGYY